MKAVANVIVTTKQKLMSKSDRDCDMMSRVTESQIAEKQPIAAAIVLARPRTLRELTSAGIHCARAIHDVVATNATGHKQITQHVSKPMEAISTGLHCSGGHHDAE